jgi:hypothetical protein
MTFNELVDKVGQPDMRTVLDSGKVVYYYTSWRGERDGAENDHYCVTLRDGQVVRHGTCPARK